MAGVGFELRKAVTSENRTEKTSGFFGAAFSSSGSMIIAITIFAVIQAAAKAQHAPQAVNDRFMCYITNAMFLSILICSLLSTVLSVVTVVVYCQTAFTTVSALTVITSLGFCFSPLTSQHLKLRSALVPVVSFSSKWVQWVLLAGVLLIEITPALLWLGIALFAMTTVFSFVTLPVEFNASSRAVGWLESAGITNYETKPMAVDALRWAACTYVIGAIGSLATLLYYISMANRR